MVPECSPSWGIWGRNKSIRQFLLPFAAKCGRMKRLEGLGVHQRLAAASTQGDERGPAGLETRREDSALLLHHGSETAAWESVPGVLAHRDCYSWG